MTKTDLREALEAAEKFLASDCQKVWDENPAGRIGHGQRVLMQVRAALAIPQDDGLRERTCDKIEEMIDEANVFAQCDHGHPARGYVIGSAELAAEILALLPDGAGGRPESFQSRVDGWMLQCFTPEIAADKVERNDRFLEEALELTQATGYSADRAHALVDYVFGRDVGDPDQEVGGVMVTLAALCSPNGLSMTDAAERELARILQPEITEKIRAKQATKPTGSALPTPPEASGEG